MSEEKSFSGKKKIKHFEYLVDLSIIFGSYFITYGHFTIDFRHFHARVCKLCSRNNRPVIGYSSRIKAIEFHF